MGTFQSQNNMWTYSFMPMGHAAFEVGTEARLNNYKYVDKMRPRVLI